MALGMTNSAGGVGSAYEFLMEATVPSDVPQVELDLSSVDMATYVGLKIHISGAWKQTSSATANNYMFFTVNNTRSIYCNILGDNTSSSFAGDAIITRTLSGSSTLNPGGFVLLDIVPAGSYTGAQVAVVNSNNTASSSGNANQAFRSSGHILIKDITFTELQTLQFGVVVKANILAGTTLRVWGLKT